MKYSGNIYTQLQPYVTAYKKNQRKFIQEDYPNLSCDRINYLNDFIEFITESPYFDRVTKLRLESKYITYEGVAQLHTERYGEAISIDGVGGRLKRDRVKFVADFGERLIIDLLYKEDFDTKYVTVLNRLRDAYIKPINLKDVVKLDLSGAESVSCTAITQLEYDKFMALIKPYTAKEIAKVQSKINKDVIAYLEYITSHDGLQDIDRERVEALRDLLN